MYVNVVSSDFQLLHSVSGRPSDGGNSRQSIPKVTMVTSPVEFHGTMGPWDQHSSVLASMEQGLRQTKKLGKGWERLNECVMMCLPIYMLAIC